MSENKKPENLLAEILYSRKRVHAPYYKDGKFTHGTSMPHCSASDSPTSAFRRSWWMRSVGC